MQHHVGGADGKMHYNPGWEPGSMKTLAAHGLAGGIVQDRMGGSFGAGFLAGSVGSDNNKCHTLYHSKASSGSGIPSPRQE
jgi:hypothetical protein